MKKALKAKGMSEDQADMVVKLVNENPELFKQVTAEIQAEVAKGKNQMTAGMEVINRHKDEIAKIMGNNQN